MFVKRARPRPSIRSRVVDDDDAAPSSPLAQSVTSSEVDAAPSPSAMDVDDEAGSVMERKKAQRKSKLSKGSRLSFGGDDESDGTPFKQKKSLLSQSLKLASSPLASSAPTTAPAASSESYSRDYLAELKAATPSRAAKKRDDEDGNGGDGLSQTARDKYASTIIEDTSAGIPDHLAVAAAKSRRKAALDAQRAGAEGEDFIALGGDKGPHPESRLMREEDEGDEGDEDLADYTEQNSRLYLGKQANKRAAARLKGEIGELIADREAEDESDEETREWEATIVARTGHSVYSEVEKKKKVQGYVSAPIPAIRPVPTISSAEGRVAQRLAQLKATKIQAEHDHETAARDITLLKEQDEDIRKQLTEVEGKREWVEGFREWVEVLGHFLEEKMPKLEDIEKDAAKYEKERSTMVVQRRAADDADDLSLFLGIPTSSTPESTTDDSAANSDARRIRRIAREDRRARRRGVMAAAVPSDVDGLSTDSELDDETTDAFTASQHDLDREVESLLADVKAVDFRDPNQGIAVWFGDWRKRYPEEYNGAFGGLSLVQAWEFWARGEMVGWQPSRSDNPIESFKWFTSLYNYSRPKPENADDDDMDLEPDVGEEGDLATEMVSKAVVPLFIKGLEVGAYDPYSTPQTRRSVDMVEVIGDLTRKESRKYISLVKAALGVFQAHVLELATAVSASGGPVAQRPPPYNPAARSAMQRYVRRRIKLIRNLLLWRRVAPTEVQDLVARVVSVVLRPVLARTWEGGGDDMAKRVLEVAGATLPDNLSKFLQQGPQL
ncbi:hypothetical protein Q8F55_000716 [Vanrija albida]|uniref:GCF C-terminal domain-containing protein n=1 Tax=Vanrija albida TaxID=181172 RepID=A0ABR3QEJ1_9TREE